MVNQNYLKNPIMSRQKILHEKDYDSVILGDGPSMIGSTRKMDQTGSNLKTHTHTPYPY